MVSVETIREFLGWCTVSNFGLMMFALVLVIRDWASKLHARMFGLDEVSVRRAYFQYFINYKIAIIVFNLVPYIALRIMAEN